LSDSGLFRNKAFGVMQENVLSLLPVKEDRNMMSKRILAALVVVFIGTSFSQAEDEPAKIKFVAPGQVLNTPKTVPTISPDGLVVTHLLESFMVTIGGDPNPEAASVCASIRSVLDKHDKPVYVKQRLIGNVDIQAGVEAVLMFHSCGKTTLVALPKSGQGDFDAAIDGVVLSGPDYLATVCLVLQRSSRDKTVNGTLTLDTLEITITDAPTKTKTKE
jgi:hypothetical protein